MSMAQSSIAWGTTIEKVFAWNWTLRKGNVQKVLKWGENWELPASLPTKVAWDQCVFCAGQIGVRGYFHWTSPSCYYHWYTISKIAGDQIIGISFVPAGTSIVSTYGQKYRSSFLLGFFCVCRSLTEPSESFLEKDFMSVRSPYRGQEQGEQGCCSLLETDLNLWQDEARWFENIESCLGPSSSILPAIWTSSGPPESQNGVSPSPIWGCWGVNIEPSTCKAGALSLGYILFPTGRWNSSLGMGCSQNRHRNA